MIRRPPRSTQSRSSAASDVYKRQDRDQESCRSRTEDDPKGVSVEGAPHWADSTWYRCLRGFSDDLCHHEERRDDVFPSTRTPVLLCPCQLCLSVPVLVRPGKKCLEDYAGW